MTNSPTSAAPQQLLTTNEFATQQRCTAQTVHKNMCLHGHHHGIKPIKKPNGRLLWRLQDLQILLSGGSA